MEPNNPYGVYGNGGYGAYGRYPQKPVSVMWSRIRVQCKRYFSILNRFGWLLPLTVSLGVCLTAWIVSQMPPDFRSKGGIIVGPQVQLKEGAVYSEEGMDNYYGTQIKLMTSLEVQKDALQRVQNLHPEYQAVPVKLSVMQEPHASIFNLSVDAQTPTYAQAYLEAVMDSYLEAKRQMRSQKSDTTTQAIQDRLVALEKDIDTDDASMHDFQEKNNIGFLQQEGNDAAVYLAQRKRQLADLQIEANLLQMLDLDQNLDRVQANANLPAAAGSSDGSDKTDSTGLNSMGPVVDYQKAKQQLELLKAQRVQLAHNLRPAHPTMVALDQQITKENDLIQTLRGESVVALKTRRDSIQIQIQNLQGVITEWEAKALDLSGRISEFDKLKTKADRDKEEYGRLLGSKDSVTVTKDVNQDSVMVMDHASEAVSTKPGWVKIILAGIGGGLLVGLAILFCIDQLDDRIGSFIELQTHFQETIVGQIPREKLTEETSLLRQNDDRLAMMEAFRSLRSSLIFFPVEGTRPKTLIITSALPNEGKTTISANLAITMAFSGAKTLLVDADMRRGRLSHLFGVTEGHGLSSILLRTLPWREAVNKTTIDNLFLVSCGPPLKHPSEHLLGKVLDQFLKDAYAEYDYVIFDSPPVTLLDDTLSLSPKIDGVMVVVRFGVSAVRTTHRTLELLGQRQANILGLICNDVAMSETEYNYGYYYRQTAANYAKEVRSPA